MSGRSVPAIWGHVAFKECGFGFVYFVSRFLLTEAEKV